MFTSREILDIALKIEQNGETVYRQAAHKSANPVMAERLAWMADEEARHMEWLMKLQDDLAPDDNRIAVNEMNSDILNDIIGKQSFTLQDIDFASVDDKRDLVDIFIEFEKDGILFYEVLRAFVKDRGVLESLDQIIAEEHRHIETLQEINDHP